MYEFSRWYVINKIEEAVKAAEAAVEDTNICNRTRLINTSYHIGQYHTWLECLESISMELFVARCEMYSDRINKVLEKEEAIR